MKAKQTCLFKREKQDFKTLRYIETSHLTYLHTYIHIHINRSLAENMDRRWRVI